LAAYQQLHPAWAEKLGPALCICRKDGEVILQYDQRHDYSGRWRSPSREQGLVDDVVQYALQPCINFLRLSNGGFPLRFATLRTTEVAFGGDISSEETGEE
jgi:hypothetical protein